MQRPAPKAEIVIEQTRNMERLLHIYAVSNDAVQWIENEAPRFGRLYQPDNGHSYTYFVDPTYDLQEVIQWLSNPQ